MKIFRRLNFEKLKLFLIIIFFGLTNGMIIKGDYNDFSSAPFFGLNNDPIINDQTLLNQPSFVPNLYMNRRLIAVLRNQNNSVKK